MALSNKIISCLVNLFLFTSIMCLANCHFTKEQIILSQNLIPAEQINVSPGNRPFFGYIDSNGVFAIPPKFVTCSYFSEGLAAVGIPCFALKKPDGSIAYEELFTLLDEHYEKYSKIYNVIFNNMDKNSIITELSQVYFNGIARHPEVYTLLIDSLNLKYITICNIYGFIDQTGATVLKDTNFQKALPFSEGLAAVQIQDKWGFINKSGKIAIEPKYLFVEAFNNGIAIAVSDNAEDYTRYYINHKGDRVGSVSAKKLLRYGKIVVGDYHEYYMKYDDDKLD